MNAEVHFATLGERGNLLAGEGWRYTWDGQTRHKVKDWQSSQCGLHLFEEDWFGTGSQDEYERLASLPKCRHCMRVLGERPTSTPSSGSDCSEANSVPPPSRLRTARRWAADGPGRSTPVPDPGLGRAPSTDLPNGPGRGPLSFLPASDKRKGLGMHDCWPYVVAFKICWPWPLRVNWTAHRWYWPPMITVWHREPGYRNSGEVCKHHVRYRDKDGVWKVRTSHRWRWHVWHYSVEIHPLEQLRRWWRQA